MLMNNWELLRCGYFLDVCISVMSSELNVLGFVLSSVEDNRSVIFRKSNFFLEFSYELESAPNYSPTIVLGSEKSRYDEAGMLSCVPLWFAISDKYPCAKYPGWRFSNKSELENVFQRIKDEILSEHIVYFIENNLALEKSIKLFETHSLNLHYAESLNYRKIQNKKKLDIAWDNKNYKFYIDLVSQIGLENMEASYREKLKIAQKYIRRDE